MRHRQAILFAVALALPAASAPARGAAPKVRDGMLDPSGFLHDSRDPVYRNPVGAVPAGTAITLRFRTFAGDAAGVGLHIHDDLENRTEVRPMSRVASGITCLDPALHGACDWWEALVTASSLTTLWYRFEISDGPARYTYRDDPGGDGGRGRALLLHGDDLTSCCADDYVVSVHDPAFAAIEWMRDAVVYQIFPDRFRNGDPTNDPTGTEPRYGYPPNAVDQIVPKSWGDHPEGYCRGYAGGCTETVRNRDYFGGDLAGITQSLDYLGDLGINVLYLNPIFDAASNHAYDTRDYFRINPFFGSRENWDRLVTEASARGIRVLLDGVFVAVSSDGPHFDRYHHFAGTGACESPGSAQRSWFTFKHDAFGRCAALDGVNAASYESWYGIDVLPLLDKTNPI